MCESKQSKDVHRKRELGSDWVYDSCELWIAPPVLKVYLCCLVCYTEFVRGNALQVRARCTHHGLKRPEESDYSLAAVLLMKTICDPSLQAKGEDVSGNCRWAPGPEWYTAVQPWKWRPDRPAASSQSVGKRLNYRRFTVSRECKTKASSKLQWAH